MTLKSSLLIILQASFLTYGMASAAADEPISDISELQKHVLSNSTTERTFDICGTILQCCSPARKNFFLQNGTNLILLVDKAFWPRLPFADGDIVRATGHTVFLRKGSAQNADCRSIALVRHGKTPSPQRIRIRDLLADHGSNDRFVRVSGLVRDLFPDDIDPMYASLVLVEDDCILYLSIRCNPQDQAQLQRLVNAIVEVNGVYSSRESARSTLGDGFRNWGPALAVAGPDAFQIVRSAPEDPFDLPDIATLQRNAPTALAFAPRHRAVGRVITAARPNGFLLRTDGGHIVNVDLMNGPRPRTETVVVAAGLPATDLYRINLVRASWKELPGRSDRADSEPSADITAEQLLTDGAGHREYKINRHGTLVRLKGTVSSLSALGDSNARLPLDCAGRTIELVSDPGTNPFAGLSVGCSVEATGVCIMDTEQWQPDRALPVIRGVTVAVRDAEDVRVLSRPSWWTPRRMFFLVCILLALVVGVVAWNLSLNALVIRRSRELLRAQAKRLTETLRVGERTRLATELHDTVAQNLSGLSLQLDAAGRLADSDPAAVKPVIAFASKALLACRRELRDCLWDLRSQALDEPDMNAAIRRALAPQLGAAQLVTRFNVPRPKLADHTVHAVLRILGELAGNAVRHGRATTLRIAGSLDDAGLRFSCTDDGCGFEVRSAPGSAQGHFGLQGIRDRIRTFNGTFELTSAPGKGTRAVVLLRPVSHEI